MAEDDREIARLQAAKLEAELELESLRAHQRHIRYIYAVRFGGLLVSALAITVGAIMFFKGIQGSFNWAFSAPHSLTAKITNASPGIGFAVIGMILGYRVISQMPVTFFTDKGKRVYYITAGKPTVAEELRRWQRVKERKRQLAEELKESNQHIANKSKN